MLRLIRKLPVVRRIWPEKSSPTLVKHRVVGSDVAIIFVHGFSGDVAKTWGSFIDLVRVEQSISSWDIVSLGFPSSLRIDVPGIWAADPGLELLAKELSTTLAVSPLANYRSIAIVAHSMGGLVAQRALLDDSGLRGRVTHLLLYGTPSNGLVKARLVAMLKRQLKQMVKDGEFVSTLRADWKNRFPTGVPFFFRTVAGDRDEFVPATSSIEPFDERSRAVVPGNHLSIIQPTCREASSAQILIDGLCGRDHVRPAIDSVLIAVELGEFQQVVEKWGSRAEELDEAALAALALALDGLGRGQEALQLLESRSKNSSLKSSDSKGILAGRIKRRWLLHRAEEDLARARELYVLALGEARAAQDHDQAFYHAINVAFIDVMAAPASSLIPESALEMARLALEQCALANVTHWRLATQGEALLVSGDLSEALGYYEKAIAMSESPRELHSMYTQASRIAVRLFGSQGLLAVEQLFGLSPNGSSPSSKPSVIRADLSFPNSNLA